MLGGGSLGALTLAVLTLLLLGAALYIVAPLRRGRFRHRSEEALVRLRQEKEIVLQLLRDLDFDRAVGKLDEEEYAEQRADAQRRAIEVMKRLDSSPRGGGEDPADRLIRRERERLDREAAR